MMMARTMIVMMVATMAVIDKGVNAIHRGGGSAHLSLASDPTTPLPSSCTQTIYTRSISYHTINLLTHNQSTPDQCLNTCISTQHLPPLPLSPIAQHLPPRPPHKPPDANHHHTAYKAQAQPLSQLHIPLSKVHWPMRHPVVRHYALQIRAV